MRGDRVWRVYGMQGGRTEDVGFGTSHPREARSTFFPVPMRFDLATGRPCDWRRERNSGFD